MSLLNVLLEGDRAFVAVDTRFLSLRDGGTFHGSKMLILSHCNVVFASRGIPTFLHRVYGVFLTTQQDMEFDEIESYLPAVLEAEFEQYMPQAQASGIPPDLFENIELVVVGWSRKEEKMVGLTITRKPGAEFVVYRMATGHIAPAFREDLSGLSVPDHTAYLVEVAKAQMRQEVAGVDGPIGGRLIVAELTRDAIEIRSVRSLQEA